MQLWRASLVWVLCACGSSSFHGDAGVDASTDAGSDVGFAEAGPRNDFTQPILDTGVPGNAPALFAGTDQSGAGPCLYEPEIGSLFPNNWLRPRFRFQTTQSENLFEIELVVANETSPLFIYTTKSGYVMDKATWATITSFGVGTMHVRVRSALVSNNVLSGGPWKGSEGDMTIAPVGASGSVVYWTTSNGTVLKGFKIGDETVQSVITPTQASTACVGCHTSTPDGLDAALSASNNAGDGSPSFIELRSVDGTASVPSYIGSGASALLARTQQYAPSFSKAHWTTGDRVMLSMFNVNGKSEIAWTDLEATSQAQGTAWDVLARGDTNAAASATFNHAGTTIAYTSASTVGSGMVSDDGRIFTVPYNNRAGGTAAPLTGASDTSSVQFYPVFAADDRYVAFDRVPTGQPNPNGGSVSYNNPNAEVFVVPSAGGTATRLRANDPPSCMSAKSPGVTNSWPKWSPEVKTAGGSSYYFLIFSSTRDPGASGGPQLYVAPMTVDAANNITTYSALYLWNQPEAEKNHTPAWDVFQLPGPN